ncbi:MULTISPECIES: hypothetical protein [Agrobacterium]|uniref:hypothetical protein n=1 Tax=Agrobacterium TaxID=357 RepID=UPI001C6F1CDC|nr:hypothetical protein [Agrobacterium pusense]MBW9069940.1 hypothetical protein [Agrobacterium pusense]MBW9084821.1 hypothetical protein [Agrobacterium pusense]MBW9125305.1 hypothetical protein [Agrobacterium pusense]MBW9137720.1 hypothetical protein [Agrobacterium pusense]
MMTTFQKPALKAMMTICVGGLFGFTLAACTSAQDQNYEDNRACYGSRHYNGCMNQQQYYRDREQLMNQEKALINAQQARENLRMLREIRRKRGDY